MTRGCVSLVAASACLSLLGCEGGPPPWLQQGTGGQTSGGETTAVDATGEAEVCTPKDASVCPDGCAWSLGTGSAAVEYDILLGVDCGQNTIVAGSFNTTLDFGGGVLEDAMKLGDTDDIFVAKLGPDGKHLWSERFGDKNDQLVYGMGVDSTGAVVLTGVYEGTIDFGAGRIKTESQAIFVAKLDAGGEPRWSRSFTTGGVDFAGSRALTVDASDNLWITGSLSGDVDFGGGLLKGGTEHKGKLFVAKLDANGEHLWSRSYGPGFGVGAQVLFDSKGNLILSGYSYGALDFDDKAPAEAGPSESGVFIVKLDPQGNVLFRRYVPTETVLGSYQGVSFQMALDSQDNLVIAGELYGERDLGGGPLGDSYFVNPQAFVAKYDASGNHLWSQIFTTDIHSGVGGVAIGEGDHIFLVGNMIGSLDVAGIELSSLGPNGVYHPFVAELDPGGAGVWAEEMAGQGSVTPMHLLLTPGAMLFSGEYKEGANLGTGPMKGHGKDNKDLFVASYLR